MITTNINIFFFFNNSSQIQEVITICVKQLNSKILIGESTLGVHTFEYLGVPFSVSGTVDQKFTLEKFTYIHI